MAEYQHHYQYKKSSNSNKSRKLFSNCFRSIMATTKIILREKKKDGTCPLTIRITQDRKSVYVYLDFTIKKDEWDSEKQRVKKSHPNSARLNNYLIKKLGEVTDTALEVQTSKNHSTARAVKQKVQPTAGSSFAAQATLYLSELKKAGKYNRYVADKPRVKHFNDFVQGDIDFPDITMALLERFKVHLKATYNIGDRTIMNHLMVIRSVFSQAIREGATDSKYYPFGKGKISIKLPQSTKVGITKEDVTKLEMVDLPDPTHDLARNLWLISYYFAGMRISDVLRLRWSDFQEMRLHYTMGKNKKTGSLKTPEKALQILAKYKIENTLDSDLVFPILNVLPNLNNDFEVQRKIAFATGRFDKILQKHVAPEAKIKGKLTMHIARHTFATLAADKIPIQMLQKLYRHSNITTTIGYQANFIHKDADEALDAVIGPNNKSAKKSTIKKTGNEHRIPL